MQQDKMKVLLYLKKSGLDKSGQAPIMGRITYKRTMAQFSSKLSCNPELWNVRESRVNGKSREAVITNAKLEQLLVSIQSAYQRLYERGLTFTASDIKDEIQGSMQGRTTFLQRYDQMLEDLHKQVGIELRESSYFSYRIVRKHLQAFISEQYHSKDISFRQITEDFLDKLQTYSIGKRKHSQAYYRRIALVVKKVCRLAFREGLIDRLPLEHTKIELGDSRLPKALDRTSLEKIQELALTDYEVELQLARNLFLFTCYTGVAFCDMVSLRKEHLVQDDTGARWLKFRRQKTNTLCRIKLLPQAEAILDLYYQPDKELLLPTIAYQAYNIHLKVLQLRAEISIPLTAHMARHSFGTLTLEAGVPIESIAKMMGHTSIKSTQIYAQITDQKIARDMDRLMSGNTLGSNLKSSCLG